MAATESTMLALGSLAPDFQLPDVVSGDQITLDRFAGKTGLLVMFISRHCPFVQHIKNELARLGRDYESRSLGILAISPNYVPQYPEDSPQKLRELAAEMDFRFPVCYDATQEVAQAYRAACTPDFYLFDAGRTLVYRGQLDASRPGNAIPVSGGDLRAAIEALLAGRAVDPVQRPSLGCNIKWRPGSEPDYY